MTGQPSSDGKLCRRQFAAHRKAEKRLAFQAGAPAKVEHISSVGHPVAAESSQVVLVVSRLHHLSAAHHPEQHKVILMLCIAKQLVIRAVQHMAVESQQPKDWKLPTGTSLRLNWVTRSADTRCISGCVLK